MHNIKSGLFNQFNQFPVCSGEGVHFINLSDKQASLVAYHNLKISFDCLINWWIAPLHQSKKPRYQPRSCTLILMTYAFPSLVSFHCQAPLLYFKTRRRDQWRTVGHWRYPRIPKCHSQRNRCWETSSYREEQQHWNCCCITGCPAIPEPLGKITGGEAEEPSEWSHGVCPVSGPELWILAPWPVRTLPWPKVSYMICYCKESY